MELKILCAAVVLGLSSAAWAGVTVQPTDEDNQQGAVPAQQPAGSQAANESLEWKFVNGRPAGQNPDAADQAATSEEGGTDQSAVSEGPAESDQAAIPSYESGDDQAARPDDDGRSEELASLGDESKGDPAAADDESGSDQWANSEEQAGDDPSANSDNAPTDLRDKVVVIIPKGWKGSVPDLIAALEASPDAEDIVVVQQDEPQAGNEPGDDYVASKMKPAVNQQ
jgi:hypothetical protein